MLVGSLKAPRIICVKLSDNACALLTARSAVGVHRIRNSIYHRRYINKFIYSIYGWSSQSTAEYLDMICAISLLCINFVVMVFTCAHGLCAAFHSYAAHAHTSGEQWLTDRTYTRLRRWRNCGIWMSFRHRSYALGYIRMQTVCGSKFHLQMSVSQTVCGVLLNWDWQTTQVEYACEIIVFPLSLLLRLSTPTNITNSSNKHKQLNKSRAIGINMPKQQQIDVIELFATVSKLCVFVIEIYCQR